MAVSSRELFPSRARRILPRMDRPTCVSLVRSLEDHPSRVPAFYVQLRAATRWLAAATYKTFDLFEKASFAATELRARLVTLRFRKMNAN